MKMQHAAVAYLKIKSALIAFACATSLIFIVSMAPAQNTRSKDSAKTATAKTAEPSAALVARGKYIVEGLSRCGQCHTPRDSNGNPEAGETLEGAAVWLKSAEPAEDWPLKAPRIAGIPPGTDADMIKLLTTGIWNDGKPLRPPMPQFRMTEPDAQAVVAYLKTLP
jgi:mono/diheme cytochrome c family protein